MPVFLVCSETDNRNLEAKIKSAFPDDEHYILREGSQWLVDTEKTTQDVAAELGIKKDRKIENAGQIERTVVFLVSNYWGFHRASLWEWMELE